MPGNVPVILQQSFIGNYIIFKKCLTRKSSGGHQANIRREEKI
jgi:hypothetical protein